MFIRKFLKLLLLLVSICALSAQTVSQPNVILLLADQLRADRLHTYGNPRPSSPSIDDLASKGVQFNRYYAVGSWSVPAQATIATSFYPSRHQPTLYWAGSGIPGLKPDATTLAQMFSKGGYQTVAFVNNSVVGAYLIGSGFGLFDEQCGGCGTPQSKASPTNDRILSWVDAHRSKPFFMYIDYWEPHYPYMPPPEHDIFKNDSYPGETVAGYSSGQRDLFLWSNAGDHQAMARAVQLYDGYLHYIDSYIGQLVAGLKQRGVLDNTIIMITSDHGELLYSHPDDYLTADHCSLYDANVHVPAILFGPGIPANKKIHAIASHLDTAPTLLDLAGLPAKPDAQGKSLVPLITGNATSVNDYVFGEQAISVQLRSVRNQRYKLILNVETGKQQLFDTRSDPMEQVDVLNVFPDVVTTLRDVLDRWQTANAPDPASQDQLWSQVASKTPVTVTDNVTTLANLHLTGPGWQIFVDPASYSGRSYWAEKMGLDQNMRTATWRTLNALRGHYRISMWNGGIPDGVQATDVPVKVRTRAGTTTLQLDQTNRGNWKVLGEFDDPISVMITNEASGRIVAGAVKFERLN